MVSIAVTLIKELFLSIIGKIAFKAILERFFTRMLIYSLEKLKDMSTNTVVDETIDDVIKSLSGKGLVVIEERVA